MVGRAAEETSAFAKAMSAIYDTRELYAEREEGGKPRYQRRWTQTDVIEAELLRQKYLASLQAEENNSESKDTGRSPSLSLPTSR